MIYLVIGRREQGKTTLARKMTLAAPSRLTFDPRRMIRAAGAMHIQRAAELPDAVDALLDAESQSGEIIYAPLEDDVQFAFSKFSAEVKRWMIEAPTRHVAILIDEVSFVDLKDPAFQWVLRCSLRDNTHIVMTSHRPVDIPPKVRAIADHWLLFACREPRDLDAVEDRCTMRVREVVQTLPPRHFIHWNDAKGTYATNNDPKSWYVALAPPRVATPPLIDSPDPVDVRTQAQGVLL